jgi:hypothetical protein
VINAIEEKLRPKIVAADRMTRGADRDKAQAIYHGLLDDVKSLKIDRNKVMHTRCSYSPSEAWGVTEHVKNFMQRLAESVK